MGDEKVESTRRMAAVAARPIPGPALILFFVLALTSPLIIGYPLLQPFRERELQALKAAQAAEGLAPGAAGYAPLANYSLVLHESLHLNQPWAFRLLNLALHLATALLLFQIIRKLLPRAHTHSPAADSLNSDAPMGRPATMVAVLAAAFFYFHPAQVATVGVVQGRGPVLGLFFATLAWWLLITEAPEPVDGRFLAPPRSWRYSLSLAAFLAGVFCEPAVIGIGLLFICLELAWVLGPRANRLPRAVGFACLSVGAAVLAFPHGGTRLPGAAHDWPTRICTVIGLAGQHFAASLTPWTGGPRIDENYATGDPGSLWIGLTVGVLVVAGAVLWLLPVSLRVISTFAPAGLLALAVSMCFGTQTPMASSNHLYLPLAIGAALLGATIEALHYRFRFAGAARGVTLQRVGLGLGLIFCALLALLAFQHSLDTSSWPP